MFTQIKAEIYLVVTVIFILAFTALCWYAYHSGETHQSEMDQIAQSKVLASYQAQIDILQKNRDEVANIFEKKLDNIQIVNTTINKNFTKELTNTVYTDCKVPETGVDIINDMVTQLNNSRKASK